MKTQILVFLLVICFFASIAAHFLIRDAMALRVFLGTSLMWLVIMIIDKESKKYQ